MSAVSERDLLRKTDSSEGISTSMLRQRIENLNTLLDQHIAARDMLQGQFGRIVYPVLSLPPEITSKIFVLSVPPDRWLHPSPHLAPLLLAQICREWRAIALDTPEIWHSISVMHSRSPGFLETLRLWLSRAKTYPILCDLSGCHPAIADAVADIVIMHCHQWEDIDLSMPSAALQRLHMDDRVCPSLRRISLGFHNMWYAGLPRPVSNTIHIGIHGAPLLRSVSILDASHLKLELPWRQLHTLDLRRADCTECLSILGQCPRLVSLCVGLSSPTVDGTPDPITLPLLQSLKVCDHCAFLRYILAPDLQEFTIHVIDSDDIPVLRSFLSRSLCSPTQISLGLLNLSPEGFLQFLLTVPPSILRFELGRDSRFYGDLIPFIRTLSTTQNILPRLRHIRLEVLAQPPTDRFCQAIIAMLRARRETSDSLACLESFELLLPYYPEQPRPNLSSMAGLTSLAADGLRLRISVAHTSTITADVLARAEESPVLGSSPPPEVVARLRHQIALIEGLVAERDALQAMAAASIRYPVLSLPAKIIAEIFIHCLPSDSSPSPSRAPLLLAQICRQWRIIALTTPSLWRSIHLEGRSTSKSSIQLLRTWLSRSKDQPLDCAFTSMDAVCADELVSSSLKNCDHWEEMNISIPVTGSSLAQLHLLDKKFPILQKLHIEYGPLVRRGIPEQIPQQLIRIVVKNAPLLRDVSISVASGHILRVNLPWTQLHTVSLDSPDFQDCIALLQCSPRLISLHLTISGQIPVTFPPVTLDSLQYLDVPATFLASLTCPNLRHLTLNFIVWEHIPLLNAFISRSSCAPTRMLFQGFASSDPETFRLIMCRLAPSIQELDLRLTRLNVRAEITQYMHAMTDAILPTLKVLRLSFEPRYDPDWDAILAVVAARRPPGASTTPLEEIELSTSTEPFLHPKIAILTAFRALQDGGLKVRISRAMRKEARQVLLDNLTN